MTIYLIAGPPGIGKSTHSKSLVPAGITIIDQDLAAYQYKKVGFSNYQDIASLTSNQRIREFLFNRESFALAVICIPLPFLCLNKTKNSLPALLWSMLRTTPLLN